MKLFLLFMIAYVQACGQYQTSDEADYTIKVHTGDVPDAGTDANVYITVYGDQDQTREHRLNTPNDDFERNNYDTFQFSDIYIGSITGIRIRHDDSGSKPGWYLDYIDVEVRYNDDYEDAHFPCDWWLATDEPGGIDRKLSPGQSCRPVEGAKSNCFMLNLENADYTIDVHTGDVNDAGTDANVYLTVFGNQTQTTEHRLDSPNDDFERNSYDVFSFTDVDVGEIVKIRIRHDNSGAKPGWWLDYLDVEKRSNGVTEKAHFPCDWWLAKDEPGGINRVLYPGQSCRPT